MVFFPGKFGLCPPGDFYFFSRSYTAGCRKYRISRPSASACLIKVELISNNGVSANCTEGGRVVGSIVKFGRG